MMLSSAARKWPARALAYGSISLAWGSKRCPREIRSHVTTGQVARFGTFSPDAHGHFRKDAQILEVDLRAPRRDGFLHGFQVEALLECHADQLINLQPAMI